MTDAGGGGKNAGYHAQNIVRAITNHNAIGRMSKPLPNCLTQAPTGRVGIQSQTLDLGSHRWRYFGRWRVGIFVGVELDPAAALRLLTGHVGTQGTDVRTHPLHHSSECRGSIQGIFHSVFHSHY